ncbi:uncharacterized protein LOC135398658 [Ornithodoros turicata]|uniref:uncharacterized protein LOC135398658 n=1 Tax=Ornithodoros turicata TaxID=34597 RepID=UPI0031387291
MWLTGPQFLKQSDDTTAANTPEYKLVEPKVDPEIRAEVATYTRCLQAESDIGTQRFQRFSRWIALVRAIANLKHIARSFRTQHDLQPETCRHWHICSGPRTVASVNDARNVILLSVQREAYTEEMKCLQKKQNVRQGSPLYKLDPFLDEYRLVRVGGRLRNADLDRNEVHPVVLPGRLHVTALLIRHHHEKVPHQGRHFTEGAIRTIRLWIVGAKRSIGAVIHKCVQCRKLRGRLEEQKMADLPKERVSTEPPFTYVGLDVFGPWTVASCRTRGGLAQSKRWAVLFTCMSIRAVHIEVIETMDTSSFINALRRFFAVRGPAKHLRSDRGTNFIGACHQLHVPTPDTDPSAIRNYLSEQRCPWVFNPPHASHMGGAWERMIGSAGRILDSMLLDHGSTKITHEVLTPFLAEVTAIINARPLVPISNDPQCCMLTPSMLLTQKNCTMTEPPGDFSNIRDIAMARCLGSSGPLWVQRAGDLLPINTGPERRNLRGKLVLGL